MVPDGPEVLVPVRQLPVLWPEVQGAAGVDGLPAAGVQLEGAVTCVDNGGGRPGGAGAGVQHDVVQAEDPQHVAGPHPLEGEKVGVVRGEADLREPPAGLLLVG